MGGLIMKKKFNCDCEFHQIGVDFSKVGSFDIISIVIYEHRSGYTGKLYKKPKIMGDVVLLGKEAQKFLKFVKEAK